MFCEANQGLKISEWDLVPNKAIPSYLLLIQICHHKDKVILIKVLMIE